MNVQMLRVHKRRVTGILLFSPVIFQQRADAGREPSR
jgi:hypothetical protein